MNLIFVLICSQVKALAHHRESELNYLTNELESLQYAFEASATGDKSLKKRINDLEMQLDTVNIKIAETEDNKRNYELNISNLKEEELENLMKLDALRRAITENLNLYRKMNALKVNALHDRAEAEV
jgi:septal ring factor EnvC (AmiA/AmiB activator)